MWVFDHAVQIASDGSVIVVDDQIYVLMEDTQLPYLLDVLSGELITFFLRYFCFAN